MALPGNAPCMDRAAGRATEARRRHGGSQGSLPASLEPAGAAKAYPLPRREIVVITHLMSISARLLASVERKNRVRPRAEAGGEAHPFPLGA